jgi:hypothetical protein
MQNLESPDCQHQNLGSTLEDLLQEVTRQEESLNGLIGQMQSRTRSDGFVQKICDRAHLSSNSSDFKEGIDDQMTCSEFCNSLLLPSTYHVWLS